MVSDRSYKEAINKVYKQLKNKVSKEGIIELYSFCEYMLNDYPGYKKNILKLTKELKTFIALYDPKGANEDIQRVFWQVLKLEAKNKVVDSALLYLERYRDDDKKFYLPRRDTLIKFGVIEALQGLVDDKYDLVTISMPPRTGKSTLETFLMALMIGWNPEESILAISYSESIVKMFYDTIITIVTDEFTYAWQELFNDKSKLESQNAKDMYINCGKPKTFKSFTARSIDGSITGRTQAGQLLVCDDLIKNQEEALNKSQLQKLWEKYSVDLMQRKLDGAKELHIATRWSTWDIIGRLQIQRDNERSKFVAVPALDNEGHSNFVYDGKVGFSDKYYYNMKDTMDSVSFKCLYMQEPVEREGILLPIDQIRRYYELPDHEPDAKWAVCDTKDKGTDFVSMPVAYQYGNDFYIVDVVFTDSTDYNFIDSSLAEMLTRHSVDKCRFESNSAGGRVAKDVSQLVIDMGGKTSIETKFTSQNKETKILIASDWILKNCLFLDKEKQSQEYKNFISQVTTYSAKSKNMHDDGIDSLAMLRNYVSSNATAARVINSLI